MHLLPLFGLRFFRQNLPVYKMNLNSYLSILYVKRNTAYQSLHIKRKLWLHGVISGPTFVHECTYPSTFSTGTMTQSMRLHILSLPIW